MPTLLSPSPPRLGRPDPCLTFAPLAWLKLQWFCHTGDTEVGGFGISAEDDLLYVSDFVTVKQQTTSVSVRFLDEAVADFFDRQIDAGLSPQRFARLWVHTHPGESVMPSATDEETFARCFGGCDWAVMAILGRTGKTYARLSFAAGPGCQLLIPTTVDWSAWPACLTAALGELAALFAQWQQEYAAHVQVLPDVRERLPVSASGEAVSDPRWWDDDSLWPDLDDISVYLEENYPYDSAPDWLTF